MRGLAVAAAAAVVLVPSAAGAPPTAPQLFPLRAGNQWTFENRRYGGEDGLSVDRASGREFRLVGFPGAPLLRVRWSGQTLQAWDRLERRWEPFLRLGARAGTTYTVDLPQPLWGGVRVTVASRRASFFNPVLRRRHSGAVRLSIAPSPELSDAGVTGLWFAPRLGPVRWAEQSIAGPIEHFLSRARVSGRTIARR
jgi:hypothetical protein